jgi:hypothetical protein
MIAWNRAFQAMSKLNAKTCVLISGVKQSMKKNYIKKAEMNFLSFKPT